MAKNSSAVFAIYSCGRLVCYALIKDGRKSHESTYFVSCDKLQSCLTKFLRNSDEIYFLDFPKISDDIIH